MNRNCVGSLESNKKTKEVIKSNKNPTIKYNKIV